MSQTSYLRLLAYSGVQHILCCVFALFFFVLWYLLSVSLDCPVLIAPLVFSNVYLHYLCLLWVQWCATHVVFLLCLSFSCVPYVASFSGFSIFDCPLRYSLSGIPLQQSLSLVFNRFVVPLASGNPFKLYSSVEELGLTSISEIPTKEFKLHIQKKDVISGIVSRWKNLL